MLYHQMAIRTNGDELLGKGDRVQLPCRRSVRRLWGTESDGMKESDTSGVLTWRRRFPAREIPKTGYYPCDRTPRKIERNLLP
jgi:hypothetical protein